jgi:porphobilinogen synthase
VSQRQRPRRNRKSEAMRGMVRENQVTPRDFIYPLFIHEGESKEEISSMPGCFRHTMATMMEEVAEAVQ